MNWMQKICRSNVEFVSVDVLWQFRDIDRTTQLGGGYTLPEDMPKLKESIKNEGVKEPLVIYYGQQNRTAFIAEGNHRLMFARELGITALPVRVYRMSRNPAVTPAGRLPMQTVPGIEPNRHGYVPADLKPSDIGIPTVGVPAIESLDEQTNPKSNYLEEY